MALISTFLWVSCVSNVVVQRTLGLESEEVGANPSSSPGAPVTFGTVFSPAKGNADGDSAALVIPAHPTAPCIVCKTARGSELNLLSPSRGNVLQKPRERKRREAAAHDRCIAEMHKRNRHAAVKAEGK